MCCTAVFAACFALSLCLETFVMSSAAGADIAATKFGSFWQLADLHYDSSYDSYTQATVHQCTSLEGLRNLTAETRRGYFGDYSCNSPWSLVKSAIATMKNIEPTPDFILWTGDILGHTPPNVVVDREDRFDLLRKVTNYLRTEFPSTPIFPVLGNHDVWHPANETASSSENFYAVILKETSWDYYILRNPVQHESFNKGGYYSAHLNDRLRLVVINSNVWAAGFVLPAGSGGSVTDPYNQFQWIESELQDAQLKNEKVLLVGHIPPGVFGRALHQQSWLSPTFNSRLLAVIQRHSNVIISAIFGHEHTDSFRVVYSDRDDALVPVFLAPSVTPWRNVLPGVGSNNPAVRLYTYTKPSTDDLHVTSPTLVVDYAQYFVNLTLANNVGRTDWKLEYRATEEFQVGALNAASLDDVITRFAADDDDDDPTSLFDRYFTHNSVTRDESTRCAGPCKRRHLCAASEVDFVRHSACLSDPEWRPRHAPSYVAQLVYRIARLPKFLFVVLCLLVALHCWRRRRMIHRINGCVKELKNGGLVGSNGVKPMAVLAKQA